jgi:tetratricopeptide (TPR) repeat protein
VLQVKLAGDKSYYSGHEGTVSVEAHDALLRGLERFWIYTRESTEAAREYFANAVKLAPCYAAAHAWQARTLVLQWVFMWDPREETLELAYEHARTAVDLDSQHPLAYSMLGWVQCWRKQGVAAIAAGRRAVALDPNHADAYIFLAITLAVSGRGEEGMRYVETGMRLNPHPSAFNQLALVFCYFVQERYEEAITAGRRGVEVSDVFTPHHVWLCVAYTQLGRDDEARFHREKALALSGGSKPVLQMIWLDETLRLKFADLMQRAGIT